MLKERINNHQKKNQKVVIWEIYIKIQIQILKKLVKKSFKFQIKRKNY